MRNTHFVLEQTYRVTQECGDLPECGNQIRFRTELVVKIITENIATAKREYAS